MLASEMPGDVGRRRTITPPVPEADVETIGQDGRTLQAFNGKFRAIHPSGKFTLKVSALGY